MLRVKEDQIIGKYVRIKRCEAGMHGNHSACVCHLVGQIVKVTKRYHVFFSDTPLYHLAGHRERVLRSEVVLIRNQQGVNPCS